MKIPPDINRKVGEAIVNYRMIEADDRIMIGLSGGVDSAVAAYLLKKQGHEVIACFMRNWDALANNDYLGNPTLGENQCPQEVDYEDAVKVAQLLDIPVSSDEMLSYFVVAEEYGRIGEESIHYGRTVVERLKTACPVKTRRAFFI